MFEFLWSIVNFIIFYGGLWCMCGAGAAWNNSDTEEDWKLNLALGPIALVRRFYLLLAGEKKG